MLMAEEPDQLSENFLRYVTGRMRPDEALSFEDRLLSDHAFSDAVALCEQELIDRYAVGNLNAADRAALQPWIEAAPRRMQRMRIALSLQELGSRTSQRRWSMRFVLPIAAAIAGLAVLTWMAGKRLGHNPGPARETAARNGASAGSGTAPKATGPSAPADQIILVVAERVRGETPTQLVTPRRNSTATLQVLLPEGAANGSYHIRLTHSEGGQSAVLDEREVKPVVTGNRLYLIAHLPEGALVPGSYTVSVDGSESFLSRITLRASTHN